ncbi:MAG: hypothetical protein ACM3SY_00770, partial [Candidatus Omnitrophota bacterium]
IKKTKKALPRSGFVHQFLRRLATLRYSFLKNTPTLNPSGLDFGHSSVSGYLGYSFVLARKNL